MATAAVNGDAYGRGLAGTPPAGGAGRGHDLDAGATAGHGALTTANAVAEWLQAHLAAWGPRDQVAGPARGVGRLALAGTVGDALLEGQVGPTALPGALPPGIAPRSPPLPGPRRPGATLACTAGGADRRGR